MLTAFDDTYKLLVLAVLVAICLFISLRIRDGRLGRAWLAIREDELAASMMGVPLVKAKLSAYAVGAFFGGLGGVGFASAVTGNVASSRFDFSVSITVLLMVVLGGMGNVWGVTIGAVDPVVDQQHRPEPARRRSTTSGPASTSATSSSRTSSCSSASCWC